MFHLNLKMKLHVIFAAVKRMREARAATGGMAGAGKVLVPGAEISCPVWRERRAKF